MSDPDDDRRKLIANERAKLTAAFLNGLAIVLMVFATLAVVFSTRAPQVSPLASGLAFAFGIVASGTLHFAARTVLRGLR